MLFEPENEYWGTACGDNCSKWILKIAEKHDIRLAFDHLMHFPENFEITLINTGKVLTTWIEMIDAAIYHLER